MAIEGVRMALDWVLQEGHALGFAPEEPNTFLPCWVS
jgi:hypothetical protein